MLDFIYDSLDTVKKLTIPTKKEFLSLIIGVFVIVIISGLFFVFTDTIFMGLYQTLHTIIRG